MTWMALLTTTEEDANYNVYTTKCKPHRARKSCEQATVTTAWSKQGVVNFPTPSGTFFSFEDSARGQEVKRVTEHEFWIIASQSTMHDCTKLNSLIELSHKHDPFVNTANNIFCSHIQNLCEMRWRSCEQSINKAEGSHRLCVLLLWGHQLSAGSL